MIYGLWDDERRVLRIANSGLPRPIYCHNGLVETVEAAGLPIGLFPNPEYDEVTYHAHEGDLFVFFSDGIVDASNIYGHMLGRSAIERVVAANCDGSAADVVDAIFAMVANHRAGVDPFDDETVVALKVRKLVPKKK
jgi:sigma-B regulation protein RsbU (phosphoserine phosphatase)